MAVELHLFLEGGLVLLTSIPDHFTAVKEPG
jgi:hypothetical protein